MDEVIQGLVNSVKALHSAEPYEKSMTHETQQSPESHNRSLHEYRTFNKASIDSEMMNSSFTSVCGIGAKIGQDGRHVVITELLDGGPAAGAGVSLGDVLVQVHAILAPPRSSSAHANILCSLNA